jgi:hypothetical protein
LAAVFAVMTAVGGARRVAAQPPSGPCKLFFDNTDTTRVRLVKVPPTDKYNTFAGNGVRAHCTNQPGVTIKSDSAEDYDAQGLLYLIGRVHYTEPRAVIDAHHMTYYVGEERLIADTNVVAVMSSGTTMHGPHADYLRQIPNVRPRAQLTATGRPHFHLVQRDSNATASPSDTAGVDAKRVFMDGDSLVYASHKVIIKRSDMIATGDSAFMNQGTGFLQLLISPVVNGTQQQHPFTLKGDIIDAYTVNHQLVRVVSIRHADAVSKDMHLTADTIDLRFTDKVLSRAYAWGPGRAHALTPERDVLADSIDVLMPEQVVHQMRAVTKARATGDPDTTKFKSKERDWMTGDTIYAYFDTSKVHPHDSTGASAPAPSAHDKARPTAQGDGTRRASRPAATPADTQPQLRTLMAVGDAHSFYQLAPRDKTLKQPALNYVRGRVITVHFENRAVQTIDVLDNAAGVYLEPQADTVSKDSLKRARQLSDTTVHPKKRKGGKGSRNAKGSPSVRDSTAKDSTAKDSTVKDSTVKDSAAKDSTSKRNAPADSRPIDTARDSTSPRDERRNR